MSVHRFPAANQPGELSAIELFHYCAEDTLDNVLWAEFVRRFGPRLKQFIRSSLRRAIGRNLTLSAAPLVMGAVQENDLLQNTILRLVSNDCAAMKRFSGSTESDLLAYLAVVTRSVVRDAARWHRAGKRPDHAAQAIGTDERGIDLDEVAITGANTERDLLVREVTEISHRALSASGQSSARDRLIFELYFVHDLSINQISQCKGVELSKAGVEKVLNRIKDRVRIAAQRGSSEAISSYD